MFDVKASLLPLITVEWAPQLSIRFLRKSGRLSSYELVDINGDMASILLLPFSFYIPLQLLVVDADRMWMLTLSRGCRVRMQSVT